MLRYLGVDTQIIDNSTPVEDLRELDGLILSGGAARIGLSGELGNCAAFLNWIYQSLVSVLVINSWRGTMEEMLESPSRNMCHEYTLVDGGGAILNTAETQTVWESHNDEVHCS